MTTVLLLLIVALLVAKLIAVALIWRRMNGYDEHFKRLLER